MKDRFGTKLNVGDTIIIGSKDGYLYKGIIERFTNSFVVYKTLYDNGQIDYWTSRVTPRKCAKYNIHNDRKTTEMEVKK